MAAEGVIGLLKWPNSIPKARLVDAAFERFPASIGRKLLPPPLSSYSGWPPKSGTIPQPFCDTCTIYWASENCSIAVDSMLSATFGSLLTP